MTEAELTENIDKIEMLLAIRAAVYNNLNTYNLQIR